MRIKADFMKVIKKITPGADGSKRFVKMYADQLVCVRYRIDSKINKRYTTIELIVEEAAIAQRPCKELKRIMPHPLQTVSVKVDFHEVEIRHQIKNYGGKWDRETKLWKIPYRIVQKLRITDRIIWPDKELDMPNNRHQIPNNGY